MSRNNKKKIIFYIAPGNSIHSYNWINYFSNNQNIVYWLSFHNYKFNGKFKRINHFFSKSLFLLSPLLSLFLYLKIKPDVVHVHSLSRNLYASSLLILFFKKKMVLTPWGSDFFYPNSITKLLQVFLFKNCLFISDSSLILKKLKNRTRKSNLHKINFGIDCNFFKKRKFSNKLIPKRKKIIFCPRGYDPIYNNKLIIDMILDLKKKINNYFFIFIGSNGSYKKILLEKLKKFNITKNTLFLGRQSRKQILKLYNISDLVISASTSDAGISSSVSEAMSCERIVLITDNRDNKLWVKNGKNGFLFKNNNLENLKKKFITITKINKKKKISIGIKARLTLLKRNNIVFEMKKVDLIYKEIFIKNTS